MDMLSGMLFIVMSTHSPSMPDQKNCRIVRQELIKKEITAEQVPEHCKFILKGNLKVGNKEKE